MVIYEVLDSLILGMYWALIGEDGELVFGCNLIFLFGFFDYELSFEWFDILFVLSWIQLWLEQVSLDFIYFGFLGFE